MNITKKMKSTRLELVRQQKQYTEACQAVAYRQITKAEGVDRFTKEEERNRRILLTLAEDLPDSVQKKIRETLKKRIFSLEEKDLFNELQAATISLEQIIQAIDRALLEGSLFPRRTDTRVEIAKEMTANPGFRCIKKGKDTYYLTQNEAWAIEYLTKIHWEGRPDASQEEVLKYVCGSTLSYEDVREMFQSPHSKAAYKALVTRGHSKGTIRLNVDLPPDSSLTA